MIKYVFLVYLVLSFLSCDYLKFKNNKETHPIDTVLYSMNTEIHFRDTFVDLGTLKQGEVKKIVYYYTNTGQYPLMLFNVQPSCGCTIAEYSHKPLEPKQSDSIVAQFDSKNKEGNYIKMIGVVSNTENKVNQLSFKVNVIK